MRLSPITCTLTSVSALILAILIVLPFAGYSLTHAAPELAHAIWGDKALHFAGIEVCEIVIC